MSGVWSVRRSTVDKLLGGVCGGLARQWNVDPVLVRVGWVVLALSGGIGLVLYAAAWLLVPADNADGSILDTLTRGQTRDWPWQAWLAIVAICCLIPLAVFSTAGIGITPIAVLALIWYFGYYRPRLGRTGPPPANRTNPERPAFGPQQSVQTPPPAAHHEPTATPFSAAAAAWQARVADVQANPGADSSEPAQDATVPVTTPAGPTWPEQSAGTVQSGAYFPGLSSSDPSSPGATELAEPSRAHYFSLPDPVGLYAPPEPVPQAKVPAAAGRSRSLAARRLRLASVVAIGVVLLGLAIADSQTGAISPAIYVSAALLVVGLTLIAATWLGRARGILPVGLVLMLVVIGMSGAQEANQFRQEYAYRSVAELPIQPVTADRGLIRFDLSDLKLTKDAALSADVGTGAIEVTVPADTHVVLDYSVANGVVMRNDQTITSGSNRTGHTELDPLQPGQHTLTLDLAADRGALLVRQ